MPIFYLASWVFFWPSVLVGHSFPNTSNSPFHDPYNFSLHTLLKVKFVGCVSVRYSTVLRILANNFLTMGGHTEAHIAPLIFSPTCKLLWITGVWLELGHCFKTRIFFYIISQNHHFCKYMCLKECFFNWTLFKSVAHFCLMDSSYSEVGKWFWLVIITSSQIYHYLTIDLLNHHSLLVLLSLLKKLLLRIKIQYIHPEDQPVESLI